MGESNVPEYQKELEELYQAFEAETTEKRLREKEAKALKDRIIELMDEHGIDEMVINGMDTLVQLSISYPEKTELNKKGLAEEVGVTQKELSRPETIINLTKEEKITQEMIEEFTVVTTPMQFNQKEYKPESD